MDRGNLFVALVFFYVSFWRVLFHAFMVGVPKKYYCCPIKILQRNKNRADLASEVSPIFISSIIFLSDSNNIECKIFEDSVITVLVRCRKSCLG